MRKSSKKLIAGVLSLAMVLTAGTLPGQTASAAAKKPKLSASKVTVKVGKSKTVKVKTLPKGAKLKKAAWASKKKNVAKVSKKAGKSVKITGVKKGSTTVTCTVTYKLKKKTKKAKLNVKVTVQAADTTVEPTKVPSGGAVTTPVPTNAPPAPQATPTAAPQETPGTPASKTNVGPDRTVAIVGGTTDSMVVKDNGNMRKGLSSLQLIAAEMGQGINLGNTMEAADAAGPGLLSEATDYEQKWNAPVTTQEYIDAVHSYGFNTIRIPVAWSNMMSLDDGTYTINEKLLGRVEEIANYALNNGMYVVINDHWDYGWWGQFGDPAWEDRAWARYEAMWKQICERFKNYSDHLILESANEELGKSLFFKLTEDGIRADPIEENEYYTADKAYELENKINQKFVDIVRASGGNNAYRHLLIAGDNTNITNTVNKKFVMPTDTAENGVSKLSISVHFYDPWTFCGDGASGGAYRDSDKVQNENNLDRMKKFTDAGYGVMIGEMGVCNPRQDGTIDWLRDTIRFCVDRNYLPFLWDTPGTYFDRGTGKMKYKDVAEMYNTLTGASGDTDIKESTGKPNTGGSGSVSDDLLTEEKLVWKWQGQWKKNGGDNTNLDGEKQTTEDINAFVRPDADNCTDQSKIAFNTWGYQAFLSLDWSTLKKPVIKMTFGTTPDTEKTEDWIGKLTMGACAADSDSASGTVEFGYDEHGGGAVEIPASLLTDWLQGDDHPRMMLTLGGKPLVTGIYVYDLGE